MTNKNWVLVKEKDKEWRMVGLSTLSIAMQDALIGKKIVTIRSDKIDCSVEKGVSPKQVAKTQILPVILHNFDDLKVNINFKYVVHANARGLLKFNKDKDDSFSG